MTTQQLTRLVRFAGIYGWRRALTKAAGRLRTRCPVWLMLGRGWPGRADTSVIGCGQFAFSTLCFFLRKHRGNRFLDAYDTDAEQARSLAWMYGFRRYVDTPGELLANPALRVLYIASPHASHTPYALAGLQRGLDVYVEKPVAVTRQQLVTLSSAQRAVAGRLLAGYNRPFAAATTELTSWLRTLPGAAPLSLSCHINGHRIPPDHWYRHPPEGTRILGNLSHWIDLAIHLMTQRGLPDWFAIQLAWADPAESDDNLSVTLTTDRHDLVSLLLTARSEPYEGINERIDLQCGDLMVHIDDFRSMTIWQGAAKQTWRFSPKDVGHERAVLQPFHADVRPWREIELTTLLSLHIRDCVLTRTRQSRFVLADELACFDDAVQTTCLAVV
ncbi:Gfo/Idh/MocA family protein [Spirosoma sp. 209]|uniref:Gfo/Idh/MocA family protein n=1 Tax=Spirosoma sp. 209 TaxID=1955701 RepID=UPI00098D4724|nr:Gfo/Idh/MocA family oxidoreductase [Spirosoma sp. 209]